MEERRENELRQFIGLNPDYYLTVWNTLRETGRRFVWHWRAFIFAPLWSAARKLFYYTAIYCVLLIAAFMLDEIIVWQFPVVLVVSVILFHGWIGLSANTIYRDYCFFRIKSIKERVSGLDEREKEYEKRGGVSFLLAIFAIVLILLILLNGQRFSQQFLFWMDYQTYL